MGTCAGTSGRGSGSTSACGGHTLRQVARDNDSGSFKVADAMSIGVAEVDGLLQHQEQAMRLLLEKAAHRRGIVYDQVVGGAALGTDKLAIKSRVKGGFGQLADRVVAGTNGGNCERHTPEGTAPEVRMKLCKKE